MANRVYFPPIDGRFPRYYDILAVGENASENEIKRAYRKLMLKEHPDKAGYSEAQTEKCARINVANEVLSDPVRRRQYDKQLREARSAGSGTGSKARDSSAPSATGSNQRRRSRPYAYTGFNARENSREESNSNFSSSDGADIPPPKRRSHRYAGTAEPGPNCWTEFSQSPPRCVHGTCPEPLDGARLFPTGRSLLCTKCGLFYHDQDWTHVCHPFSENVSVRKPEDSRTREFPHLPKIWWPLMFDVMTNGPQLWMTFNNEYWQPREGGFWWQDECSCDSSEPVYDGDPNYVDEDWKKAPYRCFCPPASHYPPPNESRGRHCGTRVTDHRWLEATWCGFKPSELHLECTQRAYKVCIRARDVQKICLEYRQKFAPISKRISERQGRLGTALQLLDEVLLCVSASYCYNSHAINQTIHKRTDISVRFLLLATHELLVIYFLLDLTADSMKRNLSEQKGLEERLTDICVLIARWGRMLILPDHIHIDVAYTLYSDQGKFDKGRIRHDQNYPSRPFQWQWAYRKEWEKAFREHGRKGNGDHLHDNSVQDMFEEWQNYQLSQEPRS
jgi:curved DNA-binding protein CbpA